MARHRFICWSVIGPCFSAPFFRSISLSLSLPVSVGICNDGAGRLRVMCVCVCVCWSVFTRAHAIIAACVRPRSDHYDWAVSLFFSLSDPAHFKLHRATLGLQVALCVNQGRVVCFFCTRRVSCAFAGVLQLSKLQQKDCWKLQY